MQWESKCWCPSCLGPPLSAEHSQVTNDWNTETLTREIFKIEAITQQVLWSFLAFVWKEKFFSISDCVPTYLTYLNLCWSWNIISNKYEGSITKRLKTWSYIGGRGRWMLGFILTSAPLDPILYILNCTESELGCTLYCTGGAVWEDLSEI